MNIVIISTGTRPAFFQQAISSLFKNAIGKGHHLTAVFDLPQVGEWTPPCYEDTTIMLTAQGASAARNIGASSIPKYRRQDRLMFLDDDVFMCPDWDWRIERTLDKLPHSVVSGHAHPFNKGHGRYEKGVARFDAASVLSTVNMAMPWEIWDDVGFFTEPGGPGGSEDVDWCARATKRGVGFAVTYPQCVIHCGLKSSSGKEIVGYDLMVNQNRELIHHYALEGKVQQV